MQIYVVMMRTVSSKSDLSNEYSLSNNSGFYPAGHGDHLDIPLGGPIRPV